MDDDLAATDALFSPLSVSDDISSLDTNFAATTASGSPTGSVATNTSGTSQTTQSGGFQTVLSGLTALFSGGVAAYNQVATETGLPLANGTKTTTVAAVAAAPVVALGMTMNQLVLVGGGIALIGALFLFRRR